MSKKSGLKIADIIKEMHRGSVASDADAKLTELVAAVKKHGKAGTLTLRIDVRPRNANEADVTADVNTKMPKAKLRPALFYFTDDNDLSRTDPEQNELPLSEGAPANVTPMKPADPSPIPQRRQDSTDQAVV